MNDTTPSPANSPRRVRAAVLVGVLVLGALALGGWKAWQLQAERSRAAQAAESSQWQALEARLDTLRADLRAQGRLLQDAAASNRVLRDEVLGLGQRNALLEDSVARLDANARQDHQALDLDEAELLLVLGAQRLHIAGDLDGARRAYALAAGVLEGLDDPGLLNLRQALAAEREALDALGPGPRAELQQRLQALDARLASLPREPQAPVPAAGGGKPPLWQRLLSPLLEIRPAGSDALMGDAERRQGEDALQLELTLARAALERGDAAGFHAALERSERWLTRLWPDSPALREAVRELQSLRQAPLEIQSPLLDSSLRQLRALRDNPGTR